MRTNTTSTAASLPGTPPTKLEVSCNCFPAVPRHRSGSVPTSGFPNKLADSVIHLGYKTHPLSFSGTTRCKNTLQTLRMPAGFEIPSWKSSFVGVEEAWWITPATLIKGYLCHESHLCKRGPTALIRTGTFGHDAFADNVETHAEGNSVQMESHTDTQAGPQSQRD